MAAPIELIKSVPLFQGLDERQLQMLASTFSERRFSTGDELMTEGRTGAGFFVIDSGEVTISIEGEDLRTLGPRDYYGEIALIDGGVRTATITAASDGVSYGLTSWQFRPLVEENASIAWPLLEAMAARTRDIEQRQR